MKLAFLLAALVWLPVNAWARVDVLVVDETEGLIESLAVNAIVGLMQQTELFGTIDTVFASVGSPYDLPFLENPTGRAYDLVIVVPRGVFDFKRIWLVTRAYPQSDPLLGAALDFLRALAAQFGGQFGLELALLDVNQSLFAGILAGFFARIDLLRAAPAGAA